MTKTTHAAVAPRLPATSVDFNALNDACAKGDDAAKAFADKAHGAHRARSQPSATGVASAAKAKRPGRKSRKPAARKPAAAAAPTPVPTPPASPDANA